MHVRLVYSSDVVAVHDVWCDDHPERQTEHDESPTSQVVLPRRSVFVREVDGRRIVAHPAVAVFYNCGDVGRVVHPTEHGDASTVLSPSPSALESLVTTSGLLPVEAVVLDGVTMLDHTRLRRGIRAAASGTGCVRLAVDELAVGLMANVVRVPLRSPTTCVTARHELIAGRVAEYLGWRVGEDISLSDVGAAIGASPFEVSRAVNRVTGRSITWMRSLLRYRHAVEHLGDDGMTLSSLAVESGFADQAHMTRSFRRHSGMTPAAARRHVTTF